MYSASNRHRTSFSGTAGSGRGRPLLAVLGLLPPTPSAAAVVVGTPVRPGPPSVPPTTASLVPNILLISIGILLAVCAHVRNDLDVFVYVKEVLDRLLAGETDYEALRPDVWKLTHPEAVRQYRVEERTARADAKAKKRARRRAARK